MLQHIPVNVLLIIWLLLPSSAIGAENVAKSSCAKLYSRIGSAVSALPQQALQRAQSAKDAFLTYAQDVKQTRGMRLLFKQDEGRDEKLLGLLTVADPTKQKMFSINNMQQYLPRKLTGHFLGKPYDVTPWNVPSHLANIPVRTISSMFGQKKQLSLLLTLPLDFYLGYKAYNAFDGIYQERLKQKYDGLVQAHAKEYDDLIQNDYRFKDIKEYLHSGKLTALQSREAAQQLLAIYNNYYRYMRDGYEKDSPEERSKKLLDNPLFLNLDNVMTKGIPQDSVGFRKEANAPTIVTPEIAEQLFGANHLLLEKYQIIPEMVKDTAAFKQMESNPDAKALIGSITNDPYTKALIILNKTGRLSHSQLIYRLQEDAFWQNKFQLWQAVGLTRLKKIDGQFTNEPLTIDTIRQESLEEIK